VDSESLFLIKYGEIAIKGKNKALFIKKLRNNIRQQLSGINTDITIRPGRFYLRVNKGEEKKVRLVLSHTFGIRAFSDALMVRKQIEDIEEASCGIAEKFLASGKGSGKGSGKVSGKVSGKGVKFKCEVRRTDKSFPFTSYEIACRIGDVLRKKFPSLAVNCSNPDWILNVEIRERAYMYGDEVPGLCGLPVSCAGKGLLLLSGGIDSPVAGYLMAKRGLLLHAVYFHTPPYTSEEALQKVRDLVGVLSSYVPGMKLLVIPFTDVQLYIKEKALNEEVTLFSRACMMKIADTIAQQWNAPCLVTGESLSQVASQTLESIRFTGSKTTLPVFRPLIGYDKEEIIGLARRIGTFDISILPYPDCCTLFAPAHPLIRPDFRKISSAFETLEIGGLLETAVSAVEVVG
jgi:thiamine biosynthesis protein ThiI